ncbi:3D domain-containing protein [Clostridium sp.]|uniref:3D domain-containing protein n=1 Tax=Clostridium sp. TaxID=1506 RepID=UPI002A90DB1D|nr:3D domain-containing protein [Clostridium sp.]MDY6012245.1 3D domain-containing protein [Clostridium sp.]
MKKILICFLTAFTLMSSTTLPSFADTLSDSKVKYNQISDQIKNLDDKISELDSEINALNNKIKTNKDRISSVEKEIDTTQLKIKSTEKQIDEGQAVLSNRLRAVYKSGNYSLSSYVAFIFESEGLGDLIERINTISKIVDADNIMITQLKDNSASLKNDAKNLVAKKEEIVKLNDENNENLKTVVAKQNDLKKSKAKFDKEKSKVQAVIKENEEKLINYPVNVISSSSSSINDLQNAVTTLKELLPQISTSSVKDKANSYISKGNDLINKKKDEERVAKEKAEREAREKAEREAQNNSNKNNNSNSSNSNSNSSNNSSSSNSSSSNNTNSSNSNTSGKKTFTMEATAYSGHNTTAMGLRPVREPNGISTVAVDSSVIPLGSKVYVEGYGVAIASDTGGAIKGNKIDLFMNSESECLQFGRRPVTVTILAYPGEW